MAARKIVGVVDATLNESKSAEAALEAEKKAEELAALEAKKEAEELAALEAEKKAEKKAKAEAKAEAKARAAQIKKDKEDHFTYTAKKVPTSVMERFNALKDLGIIEDSTSFNTFIKRALQNELIRNEKKKTI